MMRRFLLTVLVCCCLPTRGQEPPRPPGEPYINTGQAVNETVFQGMTYKGKLINDAFVNNGLFEVQNLSGFTNINGAISLTLTPYDMEGMRYYTNNNLITGSTIRFDNVDEFGYRQPAEVFINGPTGTLDLADGFNFGGLGVSFALFSRGNYIIPLSNLRVHAKTIRNQGLIRIGAGGALQVGGTNDVTRELTADIVDLSDGIISTDQVGYAYGAPSISASSVISVNNVVTYLNEMGITDQFWGAGTFTNQSVDPFLLNVNPTIIVTPDHRRTNQLFGGQYFFALTNAQSFGYTETVNPSNIVVQTVFVQTAGAHVTADVRWTPTIQDGIDFFTVRQAPYGAVVQLTTTTTNALTLQPELNSIYIADYLAAASNKNVIQNDQYPGFYKPSPYVISRLDPVGFAFPGSIVSNVVVNNSLFYGPGFTAQIVTNYYTAYQFSMENLLYNVPSIPYAGVDQLPGRIEIRGKQVNLTGAGLRGEGLVSVESDNLVSTVGTVVDAQNLKFNFATTNTIARPMRFENLAKDRVQRFHGPVQLWSGIWTNSFTNFVNTNVITVRYHTLIVDASIVSSVQEVSVADFNVRTESLNIVDNMIVSNRFMTTARDITLSGAVELRNVLWGDTNIPNVVNTTVESTGALRAAGLATFGSVDKPLTNFINRGTISSYSQTVVADNVAISGTMESGLYTPLLAFTGNLFFPTLTNIFIPSAGPMMITANRSGSIEGGTLSTFGSITLAGPVFKLNNANLLAGGNITFSVRDALQDTGLSSGNLFFSSNSFTMNNTVAIGNLLGSTFVAHPAPSAVFRTRWGTPTNALASITNIPTSANWTASTNVAYQAFRTNTAMGKLQLDSAVNSAFEFRGTQQGRALFVDLIEITGPGIVNAATLTNQLRLIADAAGSIDIYYADIVASNLQAGINLGFQNLAEYFNGKKLGGGTFHWVPSFNGPNTTEDVVIGNTSVGMNRALRRSLIIDMDGDGIANGNDDLPLENRPGPIQIANVRLGATDGHITVQFAAFAGKYYLQYAESLSGNVTWKSIADYTHTATKAAEVTLPDPDPIGESKRFYRLLFEAK